MCLHQFEIRTAGIMKPWQTPHENTMPLTTSQTNIKSALEYLSGVNRISLAVTFPIHKAQKYPTNIISLVSK